ncbi:dihydroorotate dehydrogenase [Falsirhodobacter sp. 20TX0035]|uniref:dihydroorotate dehydrogenase n=1 Tax=Falsirhodobacter sp. 20TX0035 TaxID=3022019 RepID=UPI00233107E3|nr:dihydroorotate dehydrogenase [Falsirhodobacter sp. 20TX0035]MDB6452391.1 dihydroorotate dehydrogenase [Falsirhodobacter sp. 20TX0035]
MMEQDLDDLLAAARTRAPVPSPALMARILTDAEAEQDRWQTRTALKRRWTRFLPLFLGSVGATAGMATAALAGVWIGYAQPETLTTVTAALWADQRVDLLPTYAFVTE